MSSELPINGAFFAQKLQCLFDLEPELRVGRSGERRGMTAPRYAVEGISHDAVDRRKVSLNMIEWRSKLQV